MGKKERVDVLLVERGLAETREKAKRSVMAGLVYTKSDRIDKPGMKIHPETPLFLKGNVSPFVSRGGLKLAKALEIFPFVLQDHIVLDVGASTGGFTDCALQNGARKVYAVDVGYNQLAWQLRSDPRVIVMERVNFRYSKRSDYHDGIPTRAVCDVSFISLKHILPNMASILSKDGEACVLIKPQFEAGREDVGKKGIVRNPLVYARVIKSVLQTAGEAGFTGTGLAVSPITGMGGNVEFLLYLQKAPSTAESLTLSRIEEVIRASETLS